MKLRDLFRFGRATAPSPPRAEHGDVFVGRDLNDPELLAFLRGGHATNSGASVTPGAAMRVAAAWRCVNIISGAVATLPLDLLHRVDERTRKIAIDHPLRGVLTRKPNMWQTPSEFRRMLQAHLLLRGNAYALIVRSRGNVIGLVPMHPDRVEARQLDDLAMSYRYTRRNGDQVALGQRDVMHLRGLTLDGVTGLSVISYAREALGLSLQTEQAGARLFKQGTLVGGFLKHPGQMSQEAYERLKASVDEKYAGVENAHKFIILEEGAEPASISMTATDAQFLALREFQRYDVAMFFGVPPHMLGATEKTTSWGSGIEQQNIGFVQYTLQDWLTTWTETIARDLIGDAETDVYARFYLNGLLRGDLKSRKDFYVAMLQWGVYSPNEVRAFEDENPREGGDIFYDPPNVAGSRGEDASREEEPGNEN